MQTDLSLSLRKHSKLQITLGTTGATLLHTIVVQSSQSLCSYRTTSFSTPQVWDSLSPTFVGLVGRS